VRLYEWRREREGGEEGMRQREEVCVCVCVWERREREKEGERDKHKEREIENAIPAWNDVAFCCVCKIVLK